MSRVLRLTRDLTLATATGCIAAAALGQSLPGTLLVVNREDVAGSLSLFDLPTEKEIARIPIGPGWPHEVSVSPDGRLALTAEYGLATPGERVVVIDIASADVIGHIDTGPNTKPHDTVFLPDGRHALVTLETTDELAVLDVEALTVVRRMPIGAGAREGHMITLSADGTQVYVGGRLGRGTVSIVDVAGGSPPAVLTTGLGAEAITVASTGDVWVLNQDANTISVIDPRELTILATFEAATQPRRLANLPGDRLAIINGNAETAGIRIYDVRTRAVIAMLDVPGEGVAAGGFGFLSVGRHAFVTTRADGRILLYDLDQPHAPPSTFAADHDTPDGMAWSPVRVAALDNPLAGR